MKFHKNAIQRKINEMKENEKMKKHIESKTCEYCGKNKSRVTMAKKAIYLCSPCYEVMQIYKNGLVITEYVNQRLAKENKIIIPKLNVSNIKLN